jgi:excinuclease ABC subunit B
VLLSLEFELTVISCYVTLPYPQQCDELRQYLPTNSINLFVSYYSHFTPESYLPSSDTYIAKSSAIDSDIDRLRHLATRSLVERNDCVVVASVSCIYGLGLPAEYLRAAACFEVGTFLPDGFDGLKDRLRLLRFVESDDNAEPGRGQFCVAGSFFDIGPPWEREGVLYRIELARDISAPLTTMNATVVVGVSIIDKFSTDGAGGAPRIVDSVVLYPSNHFVSSKERTEAAIIRIRAEKEVSVANLTADGKILEAQRLEERVSADLKMMSEVGFCSGIENYSAILTGRDLPGREGEPPDTLLDFFPANGDWICFIDESHVTVPQLRAMYAGNRARKLQLVRHGFRLPSALENRPLTGDEFWTKVPRACFMSATPGQFERDNSGDGDGVVEAVIRPTGVLDPLVEVVPSKGQVDHLVSELAATVAQGDRAIVTTLTKQGAEDLAAYLAAQPPVVGVLDRRLDVTYIHSGIDSVGRMEIIDAMRIDRHVSRSGNDDSGSIDVICGVNLLREGISLPSVSLVAILDADKEVWQEASLCHSLRVISCLLNLTLLHQ